jgi:cytochrome c-type biogenesis protein CcmH/NrfF
MFVVKYNPGDSMTTVLVWVWLVLILLVALCNWLISAKED